MNRSLLGPDKQHLQQVVGCSSQCRSKVFDILRSQDVSNVESRTKALFVTNHLAEHILHEWMHLHVREVSWYVEDWQPKPHPKTTERSQFGLARLRRDEYGR